MMEFVSVLSGVALVVGSIFCVIGAVGMLRLPDFYARTHAAGITDTLGAGLILVGLMMVAGPTLIAVKLLLILIFMYVVGPTAGHALFKAAYAYGVRFEEPETTGGGDANPD